MRRRSLTGDDSFGSINVSQPIRSVELSVDGIASRSFALWRGFMEKRGFF